MKRDTIIIFEDNAIDRSILVELFRSEYKILEAENGKEGKGMEYQGFLCCCHQRKAFRRS